MRCPKCGTENPAGQWSCDRCEFILDSSFLGDDILNEAAPSSEVQAINEFAGDSMIFGQLGDDGEVDSFVSGRTGSLEAIASVDVASVHTGPAAIFIGADIVKLLVPMAVPRQQHDALARRSVLSGFEQGVLDHIDGQRTLANVRGRAGLSENDMRLAMAMLLEKRMISIERPSDDLDDSTREIPSDTRELPAVQLPPPKSQPKPPPKPPPKPQPPPLPVDEPAPPVAAKPPPRPARPTPPPLPSPPQAPADEPVELPLDALQPLPAQPSAAPALPAAAAFAVPLEEDDAPLPNSSQRPAMRASPLKMMSKAPSAAPGLKPAAAPAAGLKQDGKQRAQGFYDLCMKDLQEGRSGRAFGYAKLAADADPDEPKYRELLNDWDKLAHGKGGVAVRPQSPQELLNASQQAEQSGDFERAVDMMQQLCKLSPKSGAAHNRLGVLLATRLRQYKIAYDHAMKAVELEPNNMTYQTNMLKILTKLDEDERKGKGDKAEKGGGLRGLLRR